jgi:hypothetical protein
MTYEETDAALATTSARELEEGPGADCNYLGYRNLRTEAVAVFRSEKKIRFTNQAQKQFK